MTNRELLGEDHYLLILRDFELIRARRNARKGKPDAYDMLQIQLDKMFEQHYRPFLD